MKASLKFVLAALLFTGFELSSQAQVLYLVNFNPQTGQPYTGNPNTDFGIVGTPINVNPSVSPGIANGNTATPVITYTLGSATLTLNNPYSSYQLGGANPANKITGNFLDAKPGVGTTLDTLTLSGIASGSTVNFQFIGSIQTGFTGIASVTDGTTTLQNTIAGAGGANGTGTFTNVGTFTNDPATSYTITLNQGVNEADYSAALITITPAAAPEPSTYVLMGLGLLVLTVGLRKRLAVR